MLTDTISKICVTCILVAAIAGAGALAWHGTLTGSQFLGVVVAVIGIPGTLFGAHAVATAAAAGK